MHHYVHGSLDDRREYRHMEIWMIVVKYRHGIMEEYTYVSFWVETGCVLRLRRESQRSTDGPGTCSGVPRVSVPKVIVLVVSLFCSSSRSRSFLQARLVLPQVAQEHVETEKALRDLV